MSGKRQCELERQGHHGGHQVFHEGEATTVQSNGILPMLVGLLLRGPIELALAFLRAPSCPSWLMFLTYRTRCNAGLASSFSLFSQPGRVVFPVIRRAPRPYVTYDHAHWISTMIRLRKPIKKNK